MKKYLLSLLFVFSCSYCFAQEIIMSRTGIGEELMPHKAPTILPTVFYEDGILTVQSTIPLSDITVIIRDDEGTLLYTYFIYSVAGNYILSLPSTILSEMYSVELVYGSFHLIGYF
ncbi:MAG: DUF3244 domain-containing protein [Aeriscardovia sp.]|nr:DUF3244 domain-containing protein [Aeriscardovia sp.]